MQYPVIDPSVLQNAHKMEISEPWYSHIFHGRKIVEGKKDSPTWARLRIGDPLDITCNARPGEHLYAQITDLRIYKGEDPLFNYLMSEGIGRVLPGVITITRATAVYLSYSTVEEIERYGMKAVELKVLGYVRL